MSLPYLPTLLFFQLLAETGIFIFLGLTKRTKRKGCVEIYRDFWGVFIDIENSNIFIQFIMA